jgi:aspartate/methionine/tyrosine aminotransferase
MNFSKRTAQHPTENALSRALAEVRRRPGFVDLTASNPTKAGLPYEGDAILRALAAPEALVYEPDALGLAKARDAVAAEMGTTATRVAITASTSEAYAVLFKMLCDPGEEVLVPAPSYPLLSWLGAFEGISLGTYPLEYAGRWHVDVEALSRAVTPRTRAIVVVNPNNPTGSYISDAELEAMLDLGVPLISDEVFGPYRFGPGGAAGSDSLLRATRGLVFALSGLSKVALLPQMKLGWIACGGDAELAFAAMARLDVVLDAYLSVGAPIQHALPEILRASEVTRAAVRTRTRTNLDVVRGVVRGSAMSLLDVEGGWYATLRVPETKSDEAWALELATEDSVYVHPGYFFDMSRGAHLVVSLLTPEAEFREGLARIAARVARDA